MQATVLHASLAARTSKNAARFIFPDLRELPSRQLVPAPADEPVAVPGLQFTEDELARALAASSTRSAARERKDAAASLAQAQQAATSALAERLTAFDAARQRDLTSVKSAAAGLFAAFAHTCLSVVARARLCELMGNAVERALLQADPSGSVTIEVAPELVERMRMLVDEVAQRMPALRLNVAGRMGLAPGTVLLAWDDGWAEWSLDRLKDTVTRQLDLFLESIQAPPAALAQDCMPADHDQPESVARSSAFPQGDPDEPPAERTT